MGKKTKKKSKTDWDTFFDSGAAAKGSGGGGGGGSGGGGGGGGGWHTGPASMALDGEEAAPELAGGSDGAGAVAAAPKEQEMGEAAAKGNKRRKGKGRSGGGGGGDAMDTTDGAGGRGGRGSGGGLLGVNKGAGMKLPAKRGNVKSAALKRRLAKQEKALAVNERTQERVTVRFGKKQRKAALKALY
ncbi:hypothetical protein Rsub_10127 [Raphidocelis subcapitata]|uniref:Uncharacterized protein n=1 Tax=Raphidocelis subcapitata TaxID=307507 RepID=A0A2V0PB95_9CHLO|nr:hypothetical protein Rsub_10127 [Raphidocelis subcapitata]|eukprot:GBF97116.1 hypothetical protein Rsub_10127 [Raphidocelis subcapitata]